MATLSLRIREDLKRKAQKLARQQGVSLNNFINATVAASVAQEETLAFFSDRLQGVDLDSLSKKVQRFMSQTKPGPGPSAVELRQAMGQD
ncbi:MAG: toxin-antitoxin system HicB family antitoxin [Acidimicrobiales bacterium]